MRTPALLLGIVLTGSRGGILATGATLAVMVASSGFARRAVLRRVGAVALVLVLGLQAAGLAALGGGPAGAAAVVLVVCASRGALALACRRGVPPARPDGLGRVVGVEEAAVSVDFRDRTVRITSPFRKMSKL